MDNLFGSIVDVGFISAIVFLVGVLKMAAKKIIGKKMPGLLTLAITALLGGVAGVVSYGSKAPAAWNWFDCAKYAIVYPAAASFLYQLWRQGIGSPSKEVTKMLNNGKLPKLPKLPDGPDATLRG